MTAPAKAFAIAFDFEKRQEREIPVAEVRATCEQGLSCWVDLDLGDREASEQILQQLGVNPGAIAEALDHPVAGRCDVFDECVHAAVASAELRGGRVTFAHTDMMIGERFLITLHRGPVEIIDLTRRNYRSFFYKFAQSLGFLIFEVWDHLIESYRKSLVGIEDEVEQIQAAIFGDLDDRIFGSVNKVTHDLLLLRRNVLADREVLHQLTARRSSYISDSARPHLNSMVGTLDRLGSDLTVEREILAETLNLYLGVVSHRTNKVVNRLTLLSSIFLPLTFLCGVYGMNFTYLPEKDWKYGYLYFWLAVAAIAGGLYKLMKSKRWM